MFVLLNLICYQNKNFTDFILIIIEIIHRDKKVPEGESYNVDGGSTVCNCPMGGGQILCRFIKFIFYKLY